MDRDEMRKTLLVVAAHLVRGDHLPPSEIDDWNLPKSFPRRSRAYIEEEMKRSRRSGIHLAKQLVKVADAMKGERCESLSPVSAAVSSGEPSETVAMTRGPVT